MIIVLNSADFSASNIGTLSVWRIIRALGVGATYEGPTFVDKGARLDAKVTIAEGYALGEAGVTITMGGISITAATINGNVITISIAEVTGGVVIKVPTVNINTGEEEDPEVPEATLTSISIGYTQGNTTIFESQDIDDLKRYLTVSAHYNDGSIETVNDYTLSGQLQAGISTITTSYNGYTASFNVITTEFVLPEGYTKYDYIQRKASAKGNTYAQENFIWLPAIPDLNSLSFEGRFGQKPDTTNATTGVWGARLSEGLGYSMYWNATSEEPYHLYVRGKKLETSFPKDLDDIKVVIDNPENPPYKVFINGEQVEKDVVGAGAWTTETDYYLETPMSLFNNIPAGNTSNMYINWTARIGYMMFRNSNGECVAYFTPCTNPDNKIGMYDQISKTFYTASKAAAVTVGNSGVLYQVANW